MRRYIFVTSSGQYGLKVDSIMDAVDLHAASIIDGDWLEDVYKFLDENSDSPGDWIQTVDIRGRQVVIMRSA